MFELGEGDPHMNDKDLAALEKISQRLKAIHDELDQIETRIDARAIEQAELSTAMAVAWLELFWTVEAKDC